VSISIIVVNYNSSKFIEKLIKSIRLYLVNVNYEIIIVDNCSPERDIEVLEKNNFDIKFIYLDKNCGFGYANNRGMEAANFAFFLLLNPDTYLVDYSLIQMLKEFSKNSEWGIIGPTVRYEDGRIQESALKFPNIRYEVYSMFNVLSPIIRYSKLLRRKFFCNKEYETDFLFGSCLLIKREVNELVGGFDEDYFLFAEETDYCFKVKKETQYKIIYFPKARINHVAGAVTKKLPLRRILQGYNSKLIFITKNYSRLYSFLIRYTIILLFFRKILFQELSRSKKDLRIKEVYLKIISIYKNQTPELNEC